MIIGITAVLTKLKAFVDAFTRANNAATLQGSGTKSWQNTKGTWGIASNVASTATTAASYPLASIKTGAIAATIKVGFGTSGQFGWGVAYWVADANNWYGSVTDRSSSVSTSTGYACNGCPGGYQICAGYPSCQCGLSSCTGGSGPCNYYQPCAGCGSCGPSPSCNGTGTGTACLNSCGGGCYFVNNGTSCQCENNNFVGVGSYPYTVYTTNYVYWIRTIRSNAGSVSILNSQNMLGTTDSARYFDYVQAQTDHPSDQYVRIQTVLNGAGAATHDINLTTAAKAKSFGIVLYPKTEGTQASTVDNFNYTPTA